MADFRIKSMRSKHCNIEQKKDVSSLLLFAQGRMVESSLLFLNLRNILWEIGKKVQMYIH